VSLPNGDRAPFLSELLWEIVERLAFLEERLRGDFLPDTRVGDSEAIDQRMGAWRKNCARGNEKVFAKRLGWDGLDADNARELAGRVRRISPELPQWARLLGRMIRGELPVAFEELFHPFLRLARETLRNETGAAYFLLAEEAHRQWERYLLRSWEQIAGETLDLEFKAFRSPRKAFPSLPISARRPSPASDSRRLYQSFLQIFQGDGLLRLFLEYPVLARFLATKLSQWVEAAQEFLLRLRADLMELGTHFNQGQSVGLVTGVDPGLSDPHYGGRAALRAHFAVGIKLIYKPKMFTVEAAYWDLLGWINRNSELPPFRRIRVLGRGA